MNNENINFDELQGLPLENDQGGSGKKDKSDVKNVSGNGKYLFWVVLLAIVVSLSQLSIGSETLWSTLIGFNINSILTWIFSGGVLLLTYIGYTQSLLGSKISVVSVGGDNIDRVINSVSRVKTSTDEQKTGAWVSVGYYGILFGTLLSVPVLSIGLMEGALSTVNVDSTYSQFTSMGIAGIWYVSSLILLYLLVVLYKNFLFLSDKEDLTLGKAGLNLGILALGAALVVTGYGYLTDTATKGVSPLNVIESSTESSGLIQNNK